MDSTRGEVGPYRNKKSKERPKNLKKDPRETIPRQRDQWPKSPHGEPFTRVDF